MKIKSMRFEERREYRQFRYRAILRAQRKCEICDGQSGALRLEYRKSIHIFPELAFDPSNAIVICVLCFASKWGGSTLEGFGSFYERPEWKRLRELVIRNMGVECRHCHRAPKNVSDIHVDHKLPKSVYPEKAFQIRNLEPLCGPCNEGKGASLFENSIVSSLLEAQMERARLRAKTFESRYLDRILKHIVNGPELDTLVRYIKVRHSLKRWIGSPQKIHAIVDEAEPWLRVLETPIGETMSLRL